MSSETIYLLVRADDLGSSHTANQACIDVFRHGICRSVEIMAPCPWFLEAVQYLKENPQYDVGIHLVLTSEWTGMKWGPVSQARSFVDEDGYFYPSYWSNKQIPLTFLDSAWTAEDVEIEFRAQIERVLKHIPWASHLSTHMGATRADQKIKDIFEKLAQEYDLAVDLAAHSFEPFDGFGQNSRTLLPKEKVKRLIKNLNHLQAGKWLFVDHPAYNTAEMSAIYHTCYENVALDRQGVTQAWTNSDVKDIIETRNIKLLSYADVKHGL